MDDDKPTLPAPFKADTYYRVQLSGPVRTGTMTYSPGREQTLLGTVCEEHRAQIYSAVESDHGSYEKEAGRGL